MQVTLEQRVLAGDQRGRRLHGRRTCVAQDGGVEATGEACSTNVRVRSNPVVVDWLVSGELSRECQLGVDFDDTRIWNMPRRSIVVRRRAECCRR